jgi:hypothetical protein
MAGSFANFLENELLDHVLGGNTGGNVYTPPATVYIALGTATAGTSQEGGFSSEVSGNAYARVSVANTSANWDAAASGAKANTNTITFPQATGSWGTVTQFAIMDASTSGNTLVWGDLTTSKTIGSGDTASFAAGDLDVTLD